MKYFSDRIGVMYYGKMVELAPSDELFDHPLHPYTRSLLSAIPLPDPLYERQRQRIRYEPLAEHDYSVDKPSLREIVPGHFVPVSYTHLAFLVQYVFCFKLQWFPFLMAGGSDYFSWEMCRSMIPPVLSLSFGVIAGFTRTTRAELTEVLTSEFMLLARTKGLTRAQATVRDVYKRQILCGPATRWKCGI